MSDQKPLPAHVSLSRLIRAGRERLGLTRDQLSKALGVSPATISYWESGRSRPSPRHLLKLCEFLGFPFRTAEPADGSTPSFSRKDGDRNPTEALLTSLAQSLEGRALSLEETDRLWAMWTAALALIPRTEARANTDQE